MPRYTPLIKYVKPWFSKQCEKCSKIPSRIIRHHKGNDKFLGRFNPYLLSNYHKYRKCVQLCEECHAIIHVIYREKLSLSGITITPAIAMKLRKRYIKLCDRWLAGVASWDKLYTTQHPEVIKLLKTTWRVQT